MTLPLSVVARAMRENAGLRLHWLRLAARVPASVSLSWTATVSGRTISIGSGSSVGPGALLHASAGANDVLVIGSDCRIAGGARLLTWGGRITIGNRASINTQTVLYGTGGIAIGDRVRIAAQSALIASRHAFDDRDVAIVDQGYSATGIVIEDDVWIGAGVCILDGVRVGRGAVIGAGAVVTRTIEPFEVVAGVPARVLRVRGERT